MVAFESSVAKRKPAPSTVTRWRGVMLEVDAKFPDANAITQDQSARVAKWPCRRHAFGPTVRGTWLSAASRVFRYGVDQKLVRGNPFVGVKIEVPKRKKLREKAFTTREAETILRAALASNWRDSMVASARRWVPWLCAYSGARAGEICQLRGQDVRQADGISAMTLTRKPGR